ncbi:MAG: alginate lyase family protein [Erysipelotrichaceae bacterium]|nr:alginate lyase family protein [Erysipelotrichaceae bacterium]
MKLRERSLLRLKQMNKEFTDDPRWISGWMHHYVCPDCSSTLQFSGDLKEYFQDRFVCPHCGKTVSGEDYRKAWIYIYRQKHAEQIIDAAVWKKDPAVLYSLIRYIDFYARHYEDFPMHGDRVGKGKIMSQSLDEAVFGMNLLRAVYYTADVLPEEKFLQWYRKLFLPMAEFLLPQEERIHNIAVWVHCFAGMVGAVFRDPQLTERALEGEYGLRQQFAEGLTKDGLWREGSLHYHYYTLEALTYLCEVCHDEELLRTLLRMYKAPLSLSFDGYHLPSLNDGWYPLDLSHYARQITVAAAFTGDSDLKEQVNKIRNNDPEVLRDPALLPVKERSAPIIQAEEEKHEIRFNERVAMLRGPVPMLLKSGSQVGTHLHRDALSIVIDGFSNDLGTPGYGSPINKDWYRCSLAHDTVSIDGAQTGDWLQNRTVKTANGFLAEVEGSPRNRLTKAQRSLQVKDDTVIDRMEIVTPAEHCFDWLFHCEGEMTVSVPAGPASLGTEGSYRFFTDTRRILANGETVIAFACNNKSLEIKFIIDSETEAYIASTPGYPADRKRNTLLLRKRGKEAKFLVSWKLKKE